MTRCRERAPGVKQDEGIRPPDAGYHRTHRRSKPTRATRMTSQLPAPGRHVVRRAQHSDVVELARSKRLPGLARVLTFGNPELGSVREPDEQQPVAMRPDRLDSHAKQRQRRAKTG